MQATRATPWDDLQFLYFIGYAFWNYFVTPYLFSFDGVICEEGEDHQEHGETWRTLNVTFPLEIDTHCKEQRFYFDREGHQRRHDYFTDVAKGNGARYTYDEKVFDGFLFQTRRRVVTRNEDQTTRLSGPSSVWIEVESVMAHR